MGVERLLLIAAVVALPVFPSLVDHLDIPGMEDLLVISLSLARKLC